MEITVEKLFEILKKNIIFILIVAVLFAALTFIYTKFFVSETYKAQILLYTDTPENTTLSIDQLRKATQTYIEFLDTQAFSQQVLDSLDSTIAEKYSASRLTAMTSFATVNSTEVFTITITGKSPSDLIIIGNKIAELAPVRIKNIESDANVKLIENVIENDVYIPASPNVRNNTLIGAILGMIFSFGLVFLKEMFDVRIKNTDEITSRYNLPILGGVPIFYNDVKSGKGSTANGR